MFLLASVRAPGQTVDDMVELLLLIIDVFKTEPYTSISELKVFSGQNVGRLLKMGDLHFTRTTYIIIILNCLNFLVNIWFHYFI